MMASDPVKTAMGKMPIVFGSRTEAEVEKIIRSLVERKSRKAFVFGWDRRGCYEKPGDDRTREFNWSEYRKSRGKSKPRQGGR